MSISFMGGPNPTGGGNSAVIDPFALVNALKSTGSEGSANKKIDTGSPFQYDPSQAANVIMNKGQQVAGRSPAMGALGGAASGAALGSAIGGAAAGIGGGVAAGAAAGSAAGPIGTIIGALVGAIAGGLSS